MPPGMENVCPQYFFLVNETPILNQKTAEGLEISLPSDMIGSTVCATVESSRSNEKGGGGERVKGVPFPRCGLRRPCHLEPTTSTSHRLRLQRAASGTRRRLDTLPLPRRTRQRKGRSASGRPLCWGQSGHASAIRVRVALQA